MLKKHQPERGRLRRSKTEVVPDRPPMLGGAGAGGGYGGYSGYGGAGGGGGGGGGSAAGATGSASLTDPWA